jgi:hypothetical protein
VLPRVPSSTCLLEAEARAALAALRMRAEAGGRVVPSRRMRLRRVCVCVRARASEQVDQVLQVLGLLACTASVEDDAVRSLLDAHSQEAVLNVSQMRIYMVPVLEYLLATDPLGVAFDLLVSGSRDTVRHLPFLPPSLPSLCRPSVPASLPAYLPRILICAVCTSIAVSTTNPLTPYCTRAHPRTNKHRRTSWQNAGSRAVQRASRSSGWCRRSLPPITWDPRHARSS